MKTNDALKQSHRRFLQTVGAADDAAALQVAVRLVQDAGFEPVVVGGLARAKDFDAGTPIFGKAMTAAEVRRTLGISS